MLITRSLFIAALAFALALPQSTHAAGRPQADASATLAALAQRYYDAQARFDPVYSATLAGDNRFDDQLPLDIAPPLRKKRFAMYHQVQQQLAGVDRNRLSPADALTYDLLARDLRTRIGFEKFDEHLLPLLQTSAIPMLMANFGSGQAEQPLKTVAQYDAYLKRIGHLPAWADQATVNMREGIRRGVVQPKAVTAAALAQLRALGGERIEDSPFYAPVKN